MTNGEKMIWAVAYIGELREWWSPGGDWRKMRAGAIRSACMEVAVLRKVVEEGGYDPYDDPDGYVGAMLTDEPVKVRVAVNGGSPPDPNAPPP